MKDQIEKQVIEEMAKVIKSSLDGLGYGNFNFTGDEISTMFAKAIYTAGYRKQSEIIDEFAERIKKHFTNYPEPDVWLEIPEEDFCEGIDELVAEMKGGAE